MKKLMFTVLAVAFLFLVSCKNEENVSSDNSSDAAKHKEMNARIYHAIETGDVSALDSVIAADGIDHSSPSGREVMGVDSIKADLAKVHTMFSDLKFEQLNSATDGDMTIDLVRMTGTPTMDAPAMGMMKGKAVNMMTVEVTRFKDGKAYEHWTYINPKDMMPPVLIPGGKQAMKEGAKK